MSKKPTVKELTEALKRERADSENIRKRHNQEIGSLRNLVKASIVKDLLPVIDNFERSMKHVPKDLEKNNFIKGVKGIVKQFEETLKKMGVERIKTVGEEFDPKYHEAVHMEDAPSAGGGNSPAGEEVISEELAAGYKMGDEVIRHAMVKVKSSKE